jgi:hypothetical protein
MMLSWENELRNRAILAGHFLPARAEAGPDGLVMIVEGMRPVDLDL